MLSRSTLRTTSELSSSEVLDYHIAQRCLDSSSRCDRLRAACVLPILDPHDRTLRVQVESNRLPVTLGKPCQHELVRLAAVLDVRVFANPTKPFPRRRRYF